MEKNQVSLSIGDIVSNGVSIGMKNFVNLLLASILWVVTIWIPYLNLGTTIAMIDIVARLARGEEISPTGIFDAKYRARIGEFFLFLAFYVAGLVSSYIFLATPIVQTAWSLAPFLFVDKDRDPLESLKESNKLTYGHKMTIFLAMIVIEPNAAKRLTMKPFGVAFAKFWGYPLRLTSSREEALEIAGKLLSEHAGSATA